MDLKKISVNLKVKESPVEDDPKFSEALRIQSSTFPFDRLWNMDYRPPQNLQLAMCNIKIISVEYG